VRGSLRELQNLVHDAHLIFSATVLEIGASSVENLPPQDNFAVVVVERSLRSDPGLGDLHRRKITVKLLKVSELRADDEVIFFALNWIQGGGIAAREIGHLEMQLEDDVAAEVSRLPMRHLADRLADALLVAVAEVTAIKPTPFDIRWRNAPQWATASLRKVDRLWGDAPEEMVILFPTSGRPMWARSPRLKERQRAIFLLHRPPDWPPLPQSEAPLKSAVFTVLDPADVQPVSQRPVIEALLSDRSIR
jgi:hypothetical protein